MIFDDNGLEREVMRERILGYLRKSKFESVVDLGGVMDPWAREFVTLYVDLWKPGDWVEKYSDNPKDVLVGETPSIVGDLDDPVTQFKLLAFVEENGLFDFAIASHIVEHLANPYMLLSLLPKIAKEGYIAMPSKYTELRRGGHYKHCRGIVQHRWIGTVRGGEFWLFPKLSFIEAIEFDWADHGDNTGKYPELGFRWKDEVPFNVVTDRQFFDFPSPSSIVEFYVRELKIGL